MARHCEYLTTNAAFLGTLREVYYRPEYIVDPRGKRTLEVTNLSFGVVAPDDGPMITNCPDRNAAIARYTRGEFELYARGERRATEFAKLSPMWAGMGDADGNVGSAYGYKVWYERNTPGGLTQWEWCVQNLMADRDTRRAVMFFGTPQSQRMDNRDQACTLSGQFLVRDDRLHLSMVMRSNDVVRGLCYDMPWFCHLQLRMARELGVAPGTYHHYAHSMHLYDSTVPRARAMLGLPAA